MVIFRSFVAIFGNMWKHLKSCGNFWKVTVNRRKIIEKNVKISD